ncbi:MAG TPA: DUF1573 domain-containing protein, partial [Gemmataceae bacterium]|nr:DUF1573 domain-containing protein [Gemmataceae bacterium]
KAIGRLMPSFRFVIPLVLLLAAQARSELHVSAPVLDLGEVKSGLPLIHSFELINTGPGVVEILETRASCGCLIGKVEPRTIQPAKSGTLVLRMHTLGQAAGPHTWKATVQYRQRGMEKEITVGVHVCLVTEVTVQPATLTLFTAGNLTQLVTVTDRRPKPLRVVGVQTSTSGLKAKLLKQGSGSAQIQVEIDQSLTGGRHDEILTIDTDDVGYRQLEVPVTVIKTSQSVTAIPAKVELNARVGQSASCLIRLRSESEKAVTISNIETGNPGLTCRWAPGPDSQATVRIQLDSEHWANQGLEGTVTIHLTSPNQETLVIPVSVHLAD